MLPRRSTSRRSSYVVEEAVRAGLADILIITGRGKRRDRGPLRPLARARARSWRQGQVRRAEAGPRASREHGRRSTTSVRGSRWASGTPSPSPSRTWATSRSRCCWATTSSTRRCRCCPRCCGSYEQYGRSVIAAQEVPATRSRCTAASRPSRWTTTWRGSARSSRSPRPRRRRRTWPPSAGTCSRPEIFDAIRETKPGQGRRDPAHRRDQPAGPGSGGLRLHLRPRPLRRGQQARLPEGHRRVRDRTRRPRRGVQQLARRLRPAQEARLRGVRRAAVDCRHGRLASSCARPRLRRRLDLGRGCARTRAVRDLAAVPVGSCR